MPDCLKQNVEGTWRNNTQCCPLPSKCMILHEHTHPYTPTCVPILHKCIVTYTYLHTYLLSHRERTGASYKMTPSGIVWIHILWRAPAPPSLSSPSLSKCCGSAILAGPHASSGPTSPGRQDLWCDGWWPAWRKVPELRPRTAFISKEE